MTKARPRERPPRDESPMPHRIPRGTFKFRGIWMPLAGCAKTMPRTMSTVACLEVPWVAAGRERAGYDGSSFCGPGMPRLTSTTALTQGSSLTAERARPGKPCAAPSGRRTRHDGPLLVIRALIWRA
jgi:hypothetical protein